MPPKKQTALSTFLDLLEDHVSKEDFLKNWQTIIDTVNKLKADNGREFDGIKNIVVDLGKRLKDDNSKSLTNTQAEIKALLSAELTKHDTSIQSALKALSDHIATLKDGEQGLQGEKGERGERGDDGSPDMAEDIRNKLELLEGNERLRPEAIRGLVERLDEMEEKTKRMGANFVIQRGTVKAYDLSTSLDGVKTTFSLPAFWRVIAVESSSTPFTFRNTVDYTTDGSAFTITFTNQIDPASQLSPGTTITIIYAEPL